VANGQCNSLCTEQLLGETLRVIDWQTITMENLSPTYYVTLSFSIRLMFSSVLIITFKYK